MCVDAASVPLKGGWSTEKDGQESHKLSGVEKVVFLLLLLGLWRRHYLPEAFSQILCCEKVSSAEAVSLPWRKRSNAVPVSLSVKTKTTLIPGRFGF